MTYHDDIIQAVWDKGRGMPDQNPDEWRQDQCGAWLHRPQYGQAHSNFGWKIDNISPGGAVEVDNLQPFHVHNRFDIANGRPHCRVTADRTAMTPTQGVDKPRNTDL